MRLLLDTHAFLWWLAGNERMSVAARAAVDQATDPVLVSAACAWEIATKHRIGKLPGADAIAGDIAGTIRQHGFEELAVTVRHAEQAGRLPGPHRDPFDRMLVAQALVEDLALVSNERLFDAFGVRRVW